MNPLLEKLHDIEGVGQVSFWPLAIGWWILITLGIFITALMGWYAFSYFRFKRSWKNDTFIRLAHLEKNLSEGTSRETIVALSEYLRRIVLKRFSRNECAALTGDAWLKWLSEHDPLKFDWEKRGTLLVDAPYAPTNRTKASLGEIKDLIQAVRSWVR